MILHPWIQLKVDALQPKLPKGSYDALVCSNMIHHLAYPKKFFMEADKILKPGGRIIIQEVNCSLFFRIMVRILRHEGWDYSKDAYTMKEPCNNKNDPWSANCAIPNILFDNEAEFHKKIDFFTITHRSFSEFFIFPLSGGVIAKAKTINLPFFILRIINAIDTVLVSFVPKIFALQRRIVLEKKTRH